MNQNSYLSNITQSLFFLLVLLAWGPKLIAQCTNTTLAVSSIESNYAKSGGSICSGIGTVQMKGICWSASGTPVPGQQGTFFSQNGSGAGSFRAEMTGLNPGTKYFVRSYGLTDRGTFYGNQLTFTTLAIPMLTTTGYTQNGMTAVTSGGNITLAGSSAVTQRGVCWSTAINPTTALATKTIDGSGIGSFTSNVSGLLPNTTYYLRAYAINASGTAYGNQIVISPAVADIEGNVYSTVNIGSRLWMQQNLRTRLYRNGERIPTDLPSSEWMSLTTGAYAECQNSSANAPTYGRLYNWYATADPRGLCPVGWRMPTDSEMTQLTDLLGGTQLAGGNMKSTTLWAAPNSGATNSSGFSALPAGQRTIAGAYPALTFGYNNYIWTSRALQGSNFATLRVLTYSQPSILRTDYLKTSGLSVRCVKE